MKKMKICLIISIITILIASISGCVTEDENDDYFGEKTKIAKVVDIKYEESMWGDYIWIIFNDGDIVDFDLKDYGKFRIYENTNTTILIKYEKIGRVYPHKLNSITNVSGSEITLRWSER